MTLRPHYTALTGKPMRVLEETKPTLPSHWYYDPDHYARELEAFWYREWLCVGREEDLPGAGDYLVATIGDQQVIVTRNKAGSLRAFHNTCRHRGSILCREDRGRFRNGRIICPYHTWTYSTDGDLLATPGRFEADDFDMEGIALYGVHLDTWGGFIYINLDEGDPDPLLTTLDETPQGLKNWPLEEMRSVHQETVEVACNWKVFWENFSECYHCPGVHPELSKVMPIYQKAHYSPRDFPDWQPAYEGDVGRAAVGEGMRTWSLTGQTSLPVIEGLSEEEVERGITFGYVEGTMYLAAHPDYVRSVRILPNGPESISLTVDWLLPKDFEPSDEQLDEICGLAKLVIDQDGEACELNQKGLRSRRHREGVLVPQEFALWLFHEWLREKLGETE